MIATILREATRGDRPHFSAIVLKHVPDAVIGQALCGGERGKSAVAQPCQPIRSADPKISIMILEQASYVIAQQLRRIPAVVYGEVNSIESSHTFASGEPEKAIACLQNRTHRILRHSAICLPCMQAVLA